MGRGPALRRPHADTKNTNTKEPGCHADDGVWRITFTFDPDRKAILLTAGDKTGVGEKRFYMTLTAKADERFDEHRSARKRRM